jgi:hypothetical protein
MNVCKICGENSRDCLCEEEVDAATVAKFKDNIAKYLAKLDGKNPEAYIGFTFNVSLPGVFTESVKHKCAICGKDHPETMCNKDDYGSL